MKVKKFLSLIIISLLLQIAFISNVYGNPIVAPIYFDPFFLMIMVFVLLYFFSSFVDNLIILLFIDLFVINKKKITNLVFKINLITFLPVQGVVDAYLLFFPFVDIFFYSLIIIIEVIVIIVEFFLLIGGINKLIHSHFIVESIQPVKLRKSFFAISISNTITFLSGIWFLLPFYL